MRCWHVPHVSVSADKKAYLEVFNHCTECPDFGICLGDYRNAHCLNCRNHYFCGNSGFPCDGCSAVNTWGLIGGQRLTPGPASIAAPAAWLGFEGDLDKIHEAATARRQRALGEL